MDIHSFSLSDFYGCPGTSQDIQGYPVICRAIPAIVELCASLKPWFARTRRGSLYEGPTTHPNIMEIHANTWKSTCAWILGCLDSWIFWTLDLGFLGSWIIGSLKSWILRFLNSWILGFLDSWILGLLNFWSF